MNVVPGPHVENSLTIHRDRFYKPHLMIPRPVVIAGDREAVNFIITRLELKPDAFMKFNRTSIHRRGARPDALSAMRPADFKKPLI